jgi:hypothetical protein
VTKPTSKRAGKSGAKKSSSKKTKATTRSGAKPRKARASHSPSVESAAATADAPHAAVRTASSRRREALSEAAARHEALVTWRRESANLPRATWTAMIKDPKQRVLADVVAAVCGLFGIPPDVLRADRKDQSPRSRNENSLRGITLGACIEVGIAMGLGWNELHTHPDIGRSEVIDLPPHTSTIRVAHERWLAVQGLEGVVMDVARREVKVITDMAVKRSAAAAR